ncbi:Esterase FE4 [Eumeta japonica]|uniref:Esterase FE4 n=1 Tax=Eumeta variegata TaxID=151549 RepID=A0A4C1Z255_EUMVA|nr:Esterase FE4 [Eumeta japonica]
MTDLIVEVTEGKLEGKVCKTLNNVEYFAFRGIPYAKPPINDLRFAIPEPSEPWEGVRDATQNRNICAQLDRESETVTGDEDCLYLNIYTPKLPADASTAMPVMVFIHGGGFLSGNGTKDEDHTPDFIIERNVVFVGINYRLGILGFLALDRKEAPGNMGLRDQVQALKWIKKNVAKFNGDPDNVTIFGISAGAASVEYLMLSPMARGLFHKAIAQSGSTLNHWTCNSDVKSLAFKIPLLKGKKITDDENLYKYLKDLPLKDLLVTSLLALDTDPYKGGIHFGFVPTVEKPNGWEPFLDKPTYELLVKGEFMNVPFISGFCSREGLLTFTDGPAKIEKVIKDKMLCEHLPFTMTEENETELENRLKAIYLEGSEPVKEMDDFAIDLFTDIDFFGGIYVAASLIARKNPSVYFYEFAYDGGLNYLKKKLGIDRTGACHGDDTGYIIKTLFLSEGVSDQDKLMRERIVNMWTDFARTGDPTPKTDDIITTKWQPIAETGFNYLLIDEKLRMQEGSPLPNRAKLYQELYDKYCRT